MPVRPSRTARSWAHRPLVTVLTAILVTTVASPAYAAEEDTEAPTAPGAITIVDIDTTWVEFTWTASTDNVGVARYDVNARFEDFGRSYTTATNSIRIEALGPSRTYTWQVIARDAAGNGASSPTLRLTMPPGDDQPPGAPGNPIAYDLSDTSLWLRWEHSVENVVLDRYEVFRVNTDGSRTRVSEIYQYPPGRNSTRISGLSPNTTYTFVVQARDEVGFDSPFSEPVTVTTRSAAPACAARVEVHQWGNGSVAHLVVENTSTTTIDGWTMSWNIAPNQQFHGLWGAEVLFRDPLRRAIWVDNASYNRTIAPGGSVRVGYVATDSVAPWQIALSGAICTVTPT
ncbi:fibronectin type III domain protein [Micromonospora pisi]|uniref:Fibronectin type III domain protein n=1 Tax=Micromonospora pisi TaxID=589240 RepID=A0A495JUA7_9ACTN|nr:fibronectin type III domain-containing protein [Micromonospora pisi]RKR92573.1 fibronectin type III domain protein [Micromonospora pisi]